MLRLIATMTHAADECGVTKAALSSLLRIGYLASDKIKDENNANPSGKSYVRLQRTQELFRGPIAAISTKIEVSECVADESIMGPLTFVRLLVILAKRGMLDVIPTWTQLPDGTSASTSISHVKQTTNPAIIRKFLAIAMRRITARRERGHECLRKGRPDYAGFVYTSAAELAAALIAFDNATQHTFAEKMQGVYEVLVLCLEDAAEMSLRLKRHRQALGFALCARKVGEDAPSHGAIDSSVLLKNSRRIHALNVAL